MQGAAEQKQNRDRPGNIRCTPISGQDLSPTGQRPELVHYDIHLDPRELFVLEPAPLQTMFRGSALLRGLDPHLALEGAFRWIDRYVSSSLPPYGVTHLVTRLLPVIETSDSSCRPSQEPASLPGTPGN